MITTEAVNVLKRLEALPVPRHLFVVPTCVDSRILDHLMEEGFVTCCHSQRDKAGRLQVAMHLNLTPKAERLLRPPPVTWRQKLFKASAAGVCLVALSFLILYLA